MSGVVDLSFWELGLALLLVAVVIYLVGLRGNARGGVAAGQADPRHVLDRRGRAVDLDGRDAVLIGLVVRPQPWWEPQYLIPIAGMILGTSMTSAALAGDRLQADLAARREEVEARLALGFSGREAVQPLVRASLRASMIPTVNGMMTVGLVQLPGMMTGQILAGSSPLVAVRYQIVVVCMQAVATDLL
jgi:ABC-type iron transport system FetAB permease component